MPKKKPVHSVPPATPATKRRWVQSDGMKVLRGTEVHESDYLTLDPRLVELRDAWLAKKIKADAVREKLAGLVGFYRMQSDWNAAVSAADKKPKGRDQGLWELEVFEAWLATKPLEYRRLYHTVSIVGKALFRADPDTA